MKTSIRNATIVCALAGVMAAGVAQGADIRYQNSGDYFDFLAAGNVGPNGWQNVAGVPGLPGAADSARFNWGGNTVTLAGAAPDVFRLQMGVDESGTLEVNSGGSITALQDVYAGNNNVNATGTLTVNDGGIVNVGRILWAANNSSSGFIDVNSGGLVNVTSHLWLGVTGPAIINISGTLNQTGGILGLGTSNASTPSGGTATVNIFDGGLLALNNISGSAGLPSIQAGSFINITGSGQMTLPNDFVGLLTQYADAGKIGGNGVPGMSNLAIDLDKNPGFTTVYIPEPSTFALMAFAGLGLVVRRLSRKG